MLVARQARLLLKSMVCGLLLSACAGSAVRLERAADPAHASLGPGVAPSRVVFEPDMGVRPLTRAIDQAQERVFLEAYILTDSRVVRALERAAAQGVAVYVLLERHPLGMGQQPGRMAQQLRAAGIQVRWPPSRFWLTHAKFLVLDDRVAVISTANFSRTAFSRNREVVIFDRAGADVREASNVFRADWDRIAPVVRDPNLVVAPVEARTKLVELADGARRSLDVYSEELADSRLEAQFVSLRRRGVRVRILLPWGASRIDARRVERQGVAVHWLGRPYVHAKAVVVDGREAFVGSENLSTASLDDNRELGVLIRGHAVTALETVFGSDWRQSQPVPVR